MLAAVLIAFIFVLVLIIIIALILKGVNDTMGGKRNDQYTGGKNKSI